MRSLNARPILLPSVLIMSTPLPTEAHHQLAEEFTATGMNENAARILAAALILFADKGYSATTVREIVRAADVTNPMLYYYFESKKGVFQALLDFLFQSMEDEVSQVLDQDKPLVPILRQVARIHFDACRDAPEILRFIYSVIFGPRRSRPEFDVFCAYDTIQSRVEARVQRAIEEGNFTPAGGFDAFFITDRFLGLVSNHLMSAFAIYDHVQDPDELAAGLEQYLGEKALEQMMTFFLHGASQPTGENQ